LLTARLGTALDPCQTCRRLGESSAAPAPASEAAAAPASDAAAAPASDAAAAPASEAAATPADAAAAEAPVAIPDRLDAGGPQISMHRSMSTSRGHIGAGRT
jgi:hypothetical protein